jgi:hypothetical protein
MANGVTQLLVGLAVACAVCLTVALTPVHGPNEDVAFLERVAATVERAEVVAPETRAFLLELARRHRSSLAEPELDLRRREALARITAATQQADRPQRRVYGSAQ